jgi:fluoroacetyl-CoA thioesterase
MTTEEGAQIRPGLEASCERIVPMEWTLTHYDPNLPSVFSTPAMIGLMEVATSKAVAPALAPDSITVGTRIEVDHLKAAPVGATIVAKAKLVEVKGRFLTFEVEAHNGDVLIGRGRIFRALVSHSRFREKGIAQTSR